MQQTSEQRQKSVSSNTNLSDPALQHTANKMFGGSKVAAAQWQVHNPGEYNNALEDFMRLPRASIKMGGMNTKQSIDTHHDNAAGKVEKINSRGKEIETRIEKETSQLAKQEVEFNKKIPEEAAKTKQCLGQYDSRINKEKEAIEKDRTEKEQVFLEEKEKNLTKKTGKRFIGMKD